MVHPEKKSKKHLKSFTIIEQVILNNLSKQNDHFDKNNFNKERKILKNINFTVNFHAPIQSSLNKIFSGR